MEPVVAGSFGQWTITYTAGSYGIDEGGTIMLVQRTACDWQRPQFDQPQQPGYSTVSTTGNAPLFPRFQVKQHVRPWQTWCLVIEVYGGYLEPGDTVTIVLGDRSQGSPGIRAQSFVESAHEFRILVDPTNAAMVRRLPSSPRFPIVAGDPVRLVCIVPTQMEVNDTADIYVKAEDPWGNPTQVPGSVSFGIKGDGSGRIEGNRLTSQGSGTLYIQATAGELACQSNPLTICDATQKYNRFWGDLHAQTEATVGTGTEAEYFAFGRDVARLDFISHQGNDFQVTDEDWKRLGLEVKKFHEPGKYVIFPGYEWSGNTSAGGDHNVIYLKDDQPIFRSCHWQIPEVPEDDLSPAHPIDTLCDRLRENGDALLIPHVGGRFADIRKFFDPELTPVVEIVSCWGVFEWMLWDALEREHRVGVVCNSDGHKGRPGAEGPGVGEFGIYGGLTCVLAESLTREAIFNALKARRCYGTTGTRIALWFTANDHPMGEEIETTKPLHVSARVKGTGPLEALHLYKSKEIVKTIRPKEFEKIDDSKRIRIAWEGARSRGRARRATWDGTITLSENKIISAKTVAFDSPADGIIEQDDQRIVFKSGTTGDTDGIDLILEDKKTGLMAFDSAVGTCKVNIEDLGVAPKTYHFGGVGLKVTIQRYPETVQTMELSLDCTIMPEANKTLPLFVKAVQVDGHMAWASPVYVKTVS
jgi:hypothetical protein